MPKKLTKEDIVNREPDLLSGEYEMLGEYINTTTKTLFKHNVCKYKWEITPGNFYAGHRCPKCAGCLKLTKKSFCKREGDIVSGEYLMIGSYVNGYTKTLFRHNACGYEYMVTPNKFNYGRRCPRCGGTQKLTKREFCEREEDIKSGEYSMLGEYITAKTKTLFKHNTCGYEWKIVPSNFRAGARCPRCAAVYQHNKQHLTKDEFCKREEDIQSGEYQIVGVYKNTQTKVLIKHNKCGYEWMVNPSSFHIGRRCPKCANQKMGLLKRLTKEEFINREPDLLNGRYSMLGEYITSNTKTLFKHNICGYKWETIPSNFHRGTRCPKCNESRGEKSIANILEEINIPFESQKRFNSCKYKRLLPFDFYVNNSFLVEYDGEQHFKPVDFTGKGNEWVDKSFKSGQLRDNIKTKWAKDNGIPLVRIPYTEFDNIEQIIKDNIEKYSIQKAG